MRRHLQGVAATRFLGFSLQLIPNFWQSISGRLRIVKRRCDLAKELLVLICSRVVGSPRFDQETYEDALRTRLNGQARKESNELEKRCLESDLLEESLTKDTIVCDGGAFQLLLKRLRKMNKVKAHQLRQFEEAKLVEELTVHRVSHWLQMVSTAFSVQHVFKTIFLR